MSGRRRRRTIAAFAAPLLLVAAIAVPSAAYADEGGPFWDDTPTPHDIRSSVVWDMRNGGPATSRAAKAALLGSDAAFQQYVDTDGPVVSSQDLRVQVLRLLESGGPAVRAAASTALDGTDEDRQIFVSIGFDTAWAQDERARALQVKTYGGTAVQKAATAALDAGDDAIEQFLASGQFPAQEQDERVQALQIMAAGGTATKEMAKAALDGGPDTTHEFLTSGAEVARARDQVLDSVTELAAQAQAAGQKAAAETDAAEEASAQALAAAEKAKAAAQKAAQETAAAKDSATKAAAAAGRAADAASAAASAARIAIGAAGQAHQAARAAADAAGRAATLAVLAGNAATKANSAASAAAMDKNKAAAARQAAADVLKIVASAQFAAQAAERASQVGKKAAAAAFAAASASNQADLAGAAADEAGGYSQAAGAQAARARRNAAIAHQAAGRATRAANTSVAMANRAADAAAEAGRMARDAAAHAQAAAVAANDAADHAGEAADKAAQSKLHADNAIAAAQAATAAAGEAVQVAQVGADAESERLQLVTDEGVQTAAEALASDNALEAQADWDAQEADLRDTDTKALLAAAAAPGAPVNVVLGKGRDAAMRLMATGGQYTRAAAEDALTGGEVEMHAFLTVGLDAAAEQDDRARVAEIAENGDVPAQRVAAEAALDGSIQNVRTFLTTRAYTGKPNDDRAKILQTLTVGPASHDAGTAALNGTDAQRNAYLSRGQYVAAEHDERAKILSLISATPAPGPEVQSAARIALAGPESYLRGFLVAGLAAAQERDYFLLTHRARVAALVAQAQNSAMTAQQNAYLAAQAAALANNAANQAAQYANQAAESKRQADVYAGQASASATAARQSADQAAASAAMARNAAASARADARRADQSAADARYSAFLAKSHADDARDAANAARASADAAHKSAEEAQQDYDAAYNLALTLINQEDEARRNNPDPEGSKHCDRPPGYGADPSCYPGLPGLSRDGDDGDIVCWSWQDDQKQCGYYQISPEDRRIFDQQHEAMQTLNACALMIPGCWQTLMFVFSVYGGQEATDDPQALADQAADLAMQGRLQTLMREVKLLGKLSCSKANSFDADTRVVMADRSSRPISRVRLHDKVLATDPVTGSTGAREVTALLRNDDREFTDVQVRDGRGHVATVNTTREHPFWDASRGAWTNATDLGAGDTLATAGAGTATVVKTTSFAGRQLMYNLTVDDLHTYYVLAGTTPVLVHNTYTCDLDGVEARLPNDAHTLSEHVNVTKERAIELAGKEGKGGVNGVWTNKEVAENMINLVLGDKKTPTKIDNWKKSMGNSKDWSKSLALPGKFTNGTSLGMVATKDGGWTQAGSRYMVVLKYKKGEPNNWYVSTSYPLK